MEVESDSQKNLHQIRFCNSNIPFPASPLLVDDPSGMASHQHYNTFNAFVNSNMSSYQHFGYAEPFSYGEQKSFIEDQYIFPEELFSASYKDTEDDHKVSYLYSSSQSSISSGKEQQSWDSFRVGEGAQSSGTRIKWTEELHKKFVDCVNSLGGAEKATPKAVLNLMGSEELTITHIKSHLQKYRSGKYMLESVQEESNKGMSTHEMRQLYMEISVQIKEALQMQLECEQHLRKQLEIQENMQLMIEEQMEQLRKMIKLKADKGSHDVKISNNSTTEDEPSESTGIQVLTSGEENAADIPHKIC